jgi:DNA-binding transcriptional LysR family regulator
MLNLVRLNVLGEVVRRGSFSAAAQALDYTQSAVSQAVARLEAETGTTLVVRDRRGVYATTAGATLLQHADAIFARVQAAEDDLAAVLGVRGGRLRIASFPSAGATLIPGVVAAFQHLHPGVELSLGEGEPEEIAPRLRAGEFDLALLFEFPNEDSQLSGLALTPLIEDPLWVVLPANHMLAGEPSLKLHDLSGEDWVQTSVASPCARHVVRVCNEAGFDPRVSFESDDYETVQGLVAAGVGVALIPRLALSHRQTGLVVRELEPGSPVRRIFAATVERPGVVPAAEVMRGILSEHARRFVAVGAGTST